MFFEKKYLKKKEEYLKEIINFAIDNGFKAPDFFPKDGMLYLIDRNNSGKIIYLSKLDIPSKKELLKKYSYLYNLEKVKENILEVKNEINCR